MDKIWGETKYKIGDIVRVSNTMQNFVGVVVDIMLSWDGQLRYEVYSLDRKSWAGTFNERYIKPYTLSYESVCRYGEIGVRLNHIDDENTENRLKDIVAGKSNGVIDEVFAKRLLTYIARWKQCYIMASRLYDEAEERAQRNESAPAD